MPITPTDPTFSEIDSTNLESVRKEVVWNNFFVALIFLSGSPHQSCAVPV